MSALGEQVLIKHLPDIDSLNTIAREGLPEDVLPSDELRKVYNWALDQYHRSGQKYAPSVDAIKAEWGNTLDDHEIDIEDAPDDSIEWAIDDLKGSWISKQATSFNKEFAIKVSEAPNNERVQVVVDYANALVSMAMDMDSKEDQVDVREGFEARLRAYEDRVNNKQHITGMRFGLPMIDDYTRGIHPGELAVIAAGPKVGKALAVGTRVKVPSGWRSIEDLSVGDEVIGSQGKAIRVTGVARWKNRPLMKVTLDDGGAVTVDEEHDWTVNPHSHGGRQQVVDTKTLAQKIETNHRFAYLPMPEPVQGDGGPLPVDPYLLGLLLGDGSMTRHDVTFTTADEELLPMMQTLVPEGVRVRRRALKGKTWHVSFPHPGVRGNELTQFLRDLNLIGCRSEDKFIPDQYMEAPGPARLMLLRGLLDTDGGVDGRGVTFSSASSVLARQVQELVWSLGGTARIKVKPTPRLDAHIVRLRIPFQAFHLQRKLAAYDSRGSESARPPTRRVVSVASEGRGDTVCIEVDAADSLFMVEDYILTHNSWLCALTALREWESGKSVVLYTLENSVDMTIDRMACLAQNVQYRNWQHGTCVPEEYERVRQWVESVKNRDVPLKVIQPEPGQRSVEMLVRQAQLLQADSLIIDQLTFLEPEDERAPRHIQIREMTHSLKSMISTGRNKMPCLLAHQINREGVKQADKVGYLEMYHLAEGSEVERTSDWVFGLHRTHKERDELKAKFQTLATRREVERHFMMRWSIDTGFVSVIGEHLLDRKEL